MRIIKRIITAAAILVLLLPKLNLAYTAPEPNQNMTINFNVNQRQINVSSPLQDLWDQVSTSALPSELINFLYNQRYFIAGSAVLGTYVYICRECTRINRYVECCDSWGSWHKEYSLEVLLALPPQQIAQDLVIEIQRRYSNNANPTDFIGPLISFCKSIDYEMELVNHFITLYAFLVRIHLNVLFPLNIQKCASLADTLKRLQYIKNIFLAWAADYKIEHNKRCSPFVPLRSASFSPQGERTILKSRSC